MAVRKTTSKTMKPSNTKVTKFVRLKRDQQLKDEFGSVFTEVYPQYEATCKGLAKGLVDKGVLIQTPIADGKTRSDPLKISQRKWQAKSERSWRRMR